MLDEKMNAKELINTLFNGLSPSGKILVRVPGALRGNEIKVKKGIGNQATQPVRSLSSWMRLDKNWRPRLRLNQSNPACGKPPGPRRNPRPSVSVRSLSRRENGRCALDAQSLSGPTVPRAQSAAESFAPTARFATRGNVNIAENAIPATRIQSRSRPRRPPNVRAAVNSTLGERAQRAQKRFAGFARGASKGNALNAPPWRMFDEKTKTHQGGVCRVCGCTDEYGCTVGCCWVDREYALQCVRLRPRNFRERFVSVPGGVNITGRGYQFFLSDRTN